MTSNADAINALQEAVIQIEKELGITPSTVYSNVRARLDVVEKRRANGNTPSPNSENPFIVGSTGVTISVGDGYPTENRTPGSLYLRSDGYVYEGLYARRVDNAWHRIDTDPWVASGDLNGDYLGQTVIGLQGNSISTNTPLDGYDLTWSSADGYWEPQIGFTANLDLSGTKLNQTVIGIQGRDVSATAPAAADALVWDAGNSNWEPQRMAVIFDPLDSSTTTNIKSNKGTDQSPIDDTKLGIVNFGTDSDQSTTGITDNYSSILGGDKNQVSSPSSSIIGGMVNNIYAPFTSIVGGSNNIINPSANYSTIVGGGYNILNGEYGFIGDGYGGSVSGNFSTIVNGNACLIGTSLHATIITGNNNSIVAGSDYSLIASGNNNTVNGTCSSVICGDFVTILSDRAIALHGSNITIGSGSEGTVALSAENSSVTGVYSLLFGASNIISNSGDGYSTILNGHSNSFTNSNYSLIHGTENDMSSSFWSTINGAKNTTISSLYSVSFGYTNTINGSACSLARGSTNSITSNYSSSVGYLGEAKFHHQRVYAPGKVIEADPAVIGSAQQSELILTGFASAGGVFNLYVPGTSNNLTLDNNKVYEIAIRTTILTTEGSFEVARFTHEVLAHVDTGTIIIDDNITTLSTPNGTGWTMSISSTTNEFIIQVVSAGTQARKALATVEWRELAR